MPTTKIKGLCGCCPLARESGCNVAICGRHMLCIHHACMRLLLHLPAVPLEGQIASPWTCEASRNAHVLCSIFASARAGSLTVRVSRLSCCLIFSPSHNSAAAATAVTVVTLLVCSVGRSGPGNSSHDTSLMIPRLQTSCRGVTRLGPRDPARCHATMPDRAVLAASFFDPWSWSALSACPGIVFCVR